MSQREFIEALAADLEPVRGARPWSHAMFIWCGFSWCLVGAVVLSIGPLREGILDELLASPRLALELAIGIMAGIAAIAAGLELGVPGSPAPPRLWSPPVLLFTAWVAVILFEWIYPIGLAPSTSMRGHCFLQTMLVSLPSATVALYLLHGRILFKAGRAGLLAGTAAAAIPALWMEFSCMTEPMHALQFHLSPILLIGVVTAFLAHRLFARA
jgi:hypothetical protein